MATICEIDIFKSVQISYTKNMNKKKKIPKSILFLKKFLRKSHNLLFFFEIESCNLSLPGKQITGVVEFLECRLQRILMNFNISCSAKYICNYSKGKKLLCLWAPQSFFVFFASVNFIRTVQWLKWRQTKVLPRSSFIWQLTKYNVHFRST